MTAKEYRERAWNNLSGKWGTLALIWFVYSLIVGAVGAVSSFTYGMSGIATLILAGPFSLSMAIISLNVARKADVKFEQLFDGFKNFGSAFLLGLLNTLFIFLWSLLLIVPGIIKSLSYGMSFYILRDNPQIDANDARKESMKMMNGHKWQLFCLQFSFIGWILLGILTFGILFFWISPYMEVAKAEFYEDLKQSQARVENADTVTVESTEQPKTDA